MNHSPIIKEVTLRATVEQVWSALTQADKMRRWYFDIPEFQPEVGFCFEFWGETEDKKYLHKCEIKDVILFQKLSYSWRYEGLSGESLVTFEITPLSGQVLLRLTHDGIESFPSENPDLHKENFDGGWEAIIKDSLRNYVDHHP